MKKDKTPSNPKLKYKLKRTDKFIKKKTIKIKKLRYA